MSEQHLRLALIHLAHEKPELRRHLIPLIRTAAATPEGAKSEFKQYKEKHPGTKKTPQDFLEKTEGKEKGEAKPDIRSKLKGFLKSLSGVKKETIEALRKAPQAVQQFVSDPDSRAESLKKIAKGTAKGAKGIAKGLAKSAKSELKDLKHATKAATKLFKKPPGPFTKEDKAALYSAGAYVAGAVLAAVPPGGAVMATHAVGASFAKHVSIKAVSELLDKGFLHYEWAETLAHVITASKDSEPEPEVTLMHGLTLALSETLKKGVSDEEMKRILSGDSETR